MKTSDRVI